MLSLGIYLPIWLGFTWAELRRETGDQRKLLAAAGVVVYGQRALNEYWRARPGPEVAQRVLPTDWVAIALAGAYFLSWIVAYVTTPST